MFTKLYRTRTGRITQSASNVYIGEFDIRIENGQVFEYSPKHCAYIFSASDIDVFVESKAIMEGHSQ